MDNETTLPQSLLFPDDIEEEILSRLPVKSLLRFKCVSKPWRSLIDNNRFIKKHLQNYHSYDNRRVIIHCKEHGLKQHGPNPSSMRSYLDKPFLDLTPIDDPKNKHLMSGYALDSCNGIFCIFKSNLPWSFFFWNPATRISTELPNPGFLPKTRVEIRKWGFGWDEESSAYKMFVVMSDQNSDGIGRVYSSKTNSWKRAEHIGIDLSSLCSGDGKVACGRIHWLTKCGHIETFDLKSEVFGIMEQPCMPLEDGDYLSLMVFMGFLKVVCRNNDDVKCRVWVMKESWVEEISPRVKTVATCCKPVVYVESLVSPLLGKEILCSTPQKEETRRLLKWRMEATNYIFWGLRYSIYCLVILAVLLLVINF